jgi:hypothetical protein
MGALRVRRGQGHCFSSCFSYWPDRDRFRIGGRLQQQILLCFWFLGVDPACCCLNRFLVWVLVWPLGFYSWSPCCAPSCPVIIANTAQRNTCTSADQHSTQRTTHSTHNIPHSTQHTAHSTAHSGQHTAHSTQYTAHTAHSAQYVQRLTETF